MVCMLNTHYYFPVFLASVQIFNAHISKQIRYNKSCVCVTVNAKHSGNLLSLPLSIFYIYCLLLENSRWLFKIKIGIFTVRNPHFLHIHFERKEKVTFGRVCVFRRPIHNILLISAELFKWFTYEFRDMNRFSRLTLLRLHLFFCIWLTIHFRIDIYGKILLRPQFHCSLQTNVATKIIYRN